MSDKLPWQCDEPECDRAREGNTTKCGTHNAMARKAIRTAQVQSEKQAAQKATQREKSKERRPRVPQISDKRRLQLVVYDKLRIPWLKGKKCEVCKNNDASQVHHKAGKEGELLNYVKWWLPTDDECHKRIEMNPEWAKEMGFSISRNSEEVLLELRSLNLTA